MRRHRALNHRASSGIILLLRIAPGAPDGLVRLDASMRRFHLPGMMLCLTKRESYLSMIAQVLDRHIEITPGISGGKPRIAGRRITVQNIVIWHERLGKSADELCAEHDLTLAEVYAALAYYFDHRDEIDRGIADSEAFVEALRRRTPSMLEKKLTARRGE
jgi:uncharacterized protein (DUF433 family)